MNEETMRLPDGKITYEPHVVIIDGKQNRRMPFDPIIARRMAKWILDNVPEYEARPILEELDRDIEEDLLMLERLFFFNIEADMRRIQSQIYATAIYHGLGMLKDRNGMHAEAQMKYRRHLMGAFPRWLRSKYGYDKDER